MYKNGIAGLGVVGLLVLAPPGGLNGWTAVLDSKGGSRTTGRAGVELVDGGALRASLEVDGAPAHSAGMAWAIHSGTCERLGPVHGEVNAYPPLVTDFTGETWEVATLATPLPAGEFAVAVHRSGDPGSPVVACGALRQGGP